MKGKITRKAKMILENSTIGGIPLLNCILKTIVIKTAWYW